MILPRPMLRRLIPLFLAVFACVAVIAGWAVVHVPRSVSRDTIREALKTHVSFIQLQLPDGPLEKNIDAVQDICFRMRDFSNCNVTITRLNGEVLADSRMDAWKMLNQIHQPEVKQARDSESGIGFALRPDPETGRKTYYLAQRIFRHDTPLGIIRVSLPRSEAASGMFRAMLLIVGAILAAGLLTGLIVVMMLNPSIASMTCNARTISQNIMENWTGLNDKTAEIVNLNRALALMVTQFQDTVTSETYQRKQLETMFRSMVDAVFVVDNQEFILKYNRSAADLFHSGTADISGKTILEVVRNSQLHQFVRKTLSHDAPQEEDIVFRNEDEKHLKATGVSIHNGSGTIIGAMIVLHDITRIRKLERIRRDFVANVSHELKTPITAIRGFVETLLDSGDMSPEDIARFLEIILKQTNQLHAVIEDLLSLSRLEQDSAHGLMSVKEEDLKEILAGAAGLCDRTAGEKGVVVRVESESITVSVNRTLIQQAVCNLVDNAVKYGPNNAEVVVSGNVTDHGVVIDVKDCGPGIPADHQSRVFERFYRLDKSRSRDLGGSGLGLSIVKHIAQAHGGTVTLWSEPGKGSVFTIHLPRLTQIKQTNNNPVIQQ